MDRAYLFRDNSVSGLQCKFLFIFNACFWSSQSDHRKRYFQRFDLLSSSWLFPRIHFTSESIPNDENLDNSFFGKVLLMSLLHLFEICIVYSYVWLEQSTKIWAHKNMGKTTKFAIMIPFEWGMVLKHNEWNEGSFSISDRIDQWLRSKISKSFKF